MMSLYLYAIYNGLVLGLAIFLVSSGLTLAFGIMKIFNFAHGAFFMVGAYTAYALTGQEASSLFVFLGAALVAALLIGFVGVIADFAVFRRLAGVPAEYTLMAAFGILLLSNGVSKIAFGRRSTRSIRRRRWAPSSTSAFRFRSTACSSSAPASWCSWRSRSASTAYGSASWCWRSRATRGWRTWRACGSAPEAVLRRARLRARGAGGRTAGRQPGAVARPWPPYLLYAFCVVIVGGLGSIRGAFIASILFGLAESLNAVVLPSLPGIATYSLLIILVLIRPQRACTQSSRNAGRATEPGCPAGGLLRRRSSSIRGWSSSPALR